MSAQQAVPAWVRRTGVVAVSAVAGVAAVISYDHMRTLAEHAGEGWKAYALPVSVDGMLVAASLVMLSRKRAGQPVGWLAWIGLVLGLAVSLVANVAAAEPTIVGRLVAAWPPIALGLSYELLLSLVRRSDTRSIEDESSRPVEPIEDAVKSTPELPKMPDPVAPIESIESTPDRPAEQRQSTRSNRPRKPAKSARSSAPRRSIEELRIEARNLIERNEWSADDVTAEALRKALRIGPDRARQLRDELTAIDPIDAEESTPALHVVGAR